VSDRGSATGRLAWWGRFTSLGLAIAAVTGVVDQAFKTWMLFSFDIASRQPVEVAPFLELILVWNRGVSYGLLQQDSPTGQLLLTGFMVVAAILLTLWLSRTTSRPTAVALGLIIGGAIGNAIDRTLYGAVADFFHFHIGEFSWYVFNIADIAIVAGVGVLLYETLLGERAT
jgi:signal peptidase II